MKNSQLAVLSAVILAAALIIAGGNFMLVRVARSATGIVRRRPAPHAVARRRSGSRPAARSVTIAMMPKSKGNAYFIACRKGAEEAAKELGVELLWDGPTDHRPRQAERDRRHVDHPRRRRDRRRRREPRGLSTALRKAQAEGHQGRHVGRRRRARRPRLLRQPGHAAGHRPHR